MNKIISFTTLLTAGVLLHTGSRAQNFTESPEFLKANSHWAFGDQAGLTLSSGTPAAVTTDMTANEGPAAVSDPITGDLFFYTNGESVWNASGNIMPNGDSLLGNSNYSYGNYEGRMSNFNLSTNQGTCIVPVIGEAEKYYLFSLVPVSAMSGGHGWADYSLGTLFYSVVDMSLEGGSGNIVSGFKNRTLTSDSLAEAMIVVPGDNCDIWLLVHDRSQPEIHAYHITAAGIDSTPVVSTVGNAPLLAWPEAAVITLAVSPDRQRIARKGGLMVPAIVAHFDPSTGQVSNVIELPGNNWANNFGLCFSPDNSKLYVEDNAYGLGQFDISTYDSAAIASSLVSLITPFSGGYLRAYNDTIYFRNGSGTNASKVNIHRINQPNLSGLACDIQFNALSLVSGTEVEKGFGNDVVFPLPGDTSYTLALDTIVCPSTELVLTASTTFDSVLWSDGSSDVALTVSEAGVYWVTQSNGCQYRIDTFRVETFDFPKPVIAQNEAELTVSGTYSSYQWLLNGDPISDATAATYTVLEMGDYQVVVTNSEGCVDTSDIYTITGFDDNAVDDLPGLADRIFLYPNPVSHILYLNTPVRLNLTLLDLSGRVLKQVSNAKEISVEGLAAGVYFLKCQDQQGRLIKTMKVNKRAQ